MRQLKLLRFFSVILIILLTFGFNGFQSLNLTGRAYAGEVKDSIDKAESDNLGLIIKSIEMVEEKPIAAVVYNLKTGKTLEFISGDYIEGRLIKDILDDRIILFDEITKYQYVLIYNDTVSESDEEDDDNSVPLVRTRDKKQFREGMDVTLQFKKSLNKIANKESEKETDDFLKKLDSNNIKNSSDSILDKDSGDTNSSVLNGSGANNNSAAGTAEVKVSVSHTAGEGSPKNEAAPSEKLKTTENVPAKNIVTSGTEENKVTATAEVKINKSKK